MLTNDPTNQAGVFGTPRKCDPRIKIIGIDGSVRVPTSPTTQPKPAKQPQFWSELPPLACPKSGAIIDLDCDGDCGLEFLPTSPRAMSLPYFTTDLYSLSKQTRV